MQIFYFVTIILSEEDLRILETCRTTIYVKQPSEAIRELIHKGLLEPAIMGQGVSGVTLYKITLSQAGAYILDEAHKEEDVDNPGSSDEG